MSNEITAYFKGRYGVTESLYQYDYGMIILLDGIVLPNHFDCYFEILGSDDAIPAIGSDSRVQIPNECLASSGVITLTIPLHTGENDSEVEYIVKTKVIGRARPVDDGTPEEQSAIAQALALLSQPITNIEEIVNEALSFTGDTFAEMKQELADDFDDYTETLEGDLATWKGGVEDDIDDVEADFATLQAQFDTAVAAVTTDTEVTDIRVGADGITDTTAGASVRRQFTDLKSDLKQITGNESINTWSATGNQTYIISSNKVVSGTATNPNFKRAVVSCVAGEKFTINASLTSTSNMRPYIFADSDDNVIEYAPAGFSCLNFVVTAPTGATKLYLNKRNDMTSLQTFRGVVETIINEQWNYVLNDGVVLGDYSDAEVVNWFDKTADGVHTDGYYDRNNSFVSSTTLGQSDFIPVMINMAYYTPLTNTFVLWFDENKTLIGNSDFVNGTVINRNAKYGKFIFQTANIDTFYVKCDKLMGVKLTAVSNFNGLSGVAFGTSLTYRSQSTGGYLNYLPNLSKISFDNQGIGNATILATAQYPNLDILANIKSYSNYSAKDVCILEGFVNDFFQNHDKLGVYTDSGETTVCGCVRSAINHILTENPNITLFLVLDHYGTGVNSSTAKNASNQTQYQFYEEIAKVAESMGVPVIKEYAVSGMNETTAQYFIDNIHPTLLGAKQSAYTIWSKMNEFYPKQIS